MTVNIAQEMLRILPNDRAWTRNWLVAGSRHCLLGARLRAERAYVTNNDDVSHLDDDPYTQLLARIIAEQFPEQVVLGGNPTGMIITFNDIEETHFTDIRMVLEKAEAIWDEKKETT